MAWKSDSQMSLFHHSCLLLLREMANTEKRLLVSFVILISILRNACFSQKGVSSDECSLEAVMSRFFCQFPNLSYMCKFLVLF